jgi:hypothetical protein
VAAFILRVAQIEAGSNPRHIFVAQAWRDSAEGVGALVALFFCKLAPTTPSRRRQYMHSSQVAAPLKRTAMWRIAGPLRVAYTDRAVGAGTVEA